MSINNLEQFHLKIRNGKICIGLVIGLTDPTVSELAGDAGYDFTWIDMEHSPHTIDSVKGHVMAVRGTGCAPFVRVPWNEHGIIKPVLDLAPAGVIIPMVNSADSAAAAVAACRYPPIGNRGCGVRRGNNYGKIPFDKYLESSASKPIVIVQIEDVDAVENLDEILKIPGIGSICIGPTDLSGSMGKLNQLDDPDVCKVIDYVCHKSREAGLMLGTAGGPIETWYKRRINWIALNSDSGSIFAQAKDILRHVKEV